MSLDDTEAILREHFAALAVAKKSAGLGHPVFALEHCLPNYETEALGAALGESLGRARHLADPYWVCWVVHAAEQGYEFDGLEYWQSFADSVPNWSSRGDRSQLRRWFKAFAQTYGGAEPSGAWSIHYRNICWPVTNALLPRDLQVQLAQCLFNARHQLARAYDLPSERVGQLIQRHSQAPSSRFEWFLQQHDLVGRIVHALLQGGESQSVLHAPTLHRIIGDLNSKRHAREWLKDAQRLYVPYQFRVSGQRTDFMHPAQGRVELSLAGQSGADERALLVPRLALRHVGQEKWHASLLVPSFQGLVQLHPNLRSHLERASVQISCHNEGASQAVAVLAGQPRERRLRRWPLEGEALLKFAPPNPALDLIVSAECQLKHSSVWLFKRIGEGNATQITGLNVLAGNDYIVVARDSGRISGLGRAVAIECEGAHGVALELPGVITTQREAALQAAGLVVRRTISIRPVGLLPRQWNDEGLGEWLTTEAACFAIDRDHDFDSYQIAIDGEPAQTFDCGNERTIYLQLSQLTAGRHQVSISTRRTLVKATGKIIKTCGTFELQMMVRPPSTWVPGTLCHQALVIEVHPLNPALDDLVEERLTLGIQGDHARSVDVRLVLHDTSGNALERHELLHHRLPITEDVWLKALHDFLSRANATQDFLSASGGYVLIESEDLGEYRISLRHEPRPLRWAMKSVRNDAWLRLINEGTDGDVRIERFDFARPTVSVSVASDHAVQGIDMSSVNGLFIAHAEDGHYAVVACGREAGRGLDAWKVDVDMQQLQRVADEQTLIAHYSTWAGAKPAHTIARLKQRQVLEAMHQHMLFWSCGEPWMRRETELIEQPSAGAWDRLERAVWPNAPMTYAISLVRGWQEAASSSPDGLRLHYLKVSKIYRVASDDEAIKRGWHLATAPGALVGLQPLNAAINARDFAALVRGARLLHHCRSFERAPS